MKNRSRLLTILILTLAVLITTAVSDNAFARKVPGHQSIKTSKCSYEVYLPSGYRAGNKYPMLVTLSPGGNGRDFESAARGACSRMGWIMIGSNDFRNGVPNNVVLPKVDAAIADAVKRFGADKSNLYIGGFSGGGMGSYFMAIRHPGWFKGLVINAGRIHPQYQKLSYLRKMRVPRIVMISGKQDGVVTPAKMKEHEKMLRQVGINVLFLSWNGSHGIAPSTYWNRGLQWLLRGY